MQTITMMLLIILSISACNEHLPSNDLEKNIERRNNSINIDNRVSVNASISDIEAFTDTLYPVLIENCSMCHDTSSTPQAQPLFADENYAIAYRETVSNNLVNLISPNLSLIATKLRTEYHNCWSNTPNACFEDTITMQTEISKWADLIKLTLLVDTDEDLPDLIPGDGICQTRNNTCTLRAAIQEANLSAEIITIELLPTISTFYISLIGLDNNSEKGDLDILRSVRIVGTGANLQTIKIITSDNTDFRAFHISPFKEPNINVRIDHVTIRGGISEKGAGIYLENGSLTLNGVVITENKGKLGSSAQGAGIYNASGTLIMKRSTIYNNTITGNAQGYGGGIYVANTAISTHIVNSTISGNTITGSLGAGIYNASLNLNITNTTIVNNVIFDSLGTGGGLANIGHLKIKNSIVAQNFMNRSISDCFGEIVSGGYNIIGNADECMGINNRGDLTGSITTPLDPKIKPLKNNGGSTLTHALQGESPALNSGDPIACFDYQEAKLNFDQRGFNRPARFGNNTPRCDIGAFEFSASQGPPVNFDVMAQSMSIEAYSDTQVSGSLAASNTIGHRLMAFNIIAYPEKGSLNFHSTFSSMFTYKPYAEKIGMDSFIFEAKIPNNKRSQPTKITININDSGVVISSPPVTQVINITVVKGTTIRGTLSFYSFSRKTVQFKSETNQPSDKGTYSIIPDVDSLNVPTGTATYTYISDMNQTGNDSFKYTVSNEFSISVGTVKITIL